MPGQVIFAEDYRSRPATLTEMVRAGQIRRLDRGIYTTDLRSPPAAVIRANWVEILSRLMPGTVISDRSAVAGSPDPRGNLFVVHDRVRPLRLSGLTVYARPGPGPLEGDAALVTGLWLASPARGLIDNQVPSRGSGSVPPRTLSDTELGDWVADLASRLPVARLNRIRDLTRHLGEEMGRTEAAARAADLIGTALGTTDAETPSAALKARRAGFGYDQRRVHLFEEMAGMLAEAPPSSIVLGPDDARRQATLPFWEAYFTNFIEGTEFEPDEAARIVFEGEVPEARPADAHDITGTYEIVADPDEMATLPRDRQDLIEILKSRHSRLMSARPEARPGEWKEKANRVGGRVFVDPDLVEGTLRASWETIAALRAPMARAMAVMFVVSEVHPFADANGRIARIMMNAELVAANQTRIVIPTVYRDNYLSALRAGTNHATFEQLYAVLDFARGWVSLGDWSDLSSARVYLDETHALASPQEADESGFRLLLPGPAS
ncbi:MAG TPA: Fic family protein [Acidimicrobiales bacterium]|nr:Fic family protein [Acidimicrobiales bacterium]